MAIHPSRQAGIAVLVLTAALAGCTSYIKRDEFDKTIAELRATDQQLASQPTGEKPRSARSAWSGAPAQRHSPGL